MNTLDRDWFGAPAPAPARWAPRTGCGRLHFSGRADAPPNRLDRDSEGAFTEGLWGADGAELFLLNPAPGLYVEFNLSPGGAWWCCAFGAPRARAGAGPAPLPGAAARAAGRGAGWLSELTVPLASLPSGLAFDAGATKGNIAFCLGRPRRCFTLADLGGGAPDFHRPERWIPLREILGR
jgi:hypothetical protein